MVNNPLSRIYWILFDGDGAEKNQAGDVGAYISRTMKDRTAVAASVSSKPTDYAFTAALATVSLHTSRPSDLILPLPLMPPATTMFLTAGAIIAMT